MKYIKSFNESIGNFIKEVDQLCYDSLVYLKDEGFIYHTDPYNDYELLLYINGTKEVKFVDILPDLQPFIELLSENVMVKGIEANFYFKTHKYNFIGDRVKEVFTVDKLLNDEFDGPVYNTPTIISIRFELGRKKVPFSNKIKSFFSK